MFDRTERQVIPGYDLYGTVGRVHDALLRDGQILLQQVSPTSWVGKGPVVGIGFAIKATVIGTPAPNGGFVLSIALEADLEDMGIVWLGVGWFVCFPVALVLYLVAWKDAGKRQASLFASAWQSAFAGALAGPPAGYPALPPR